MTDFIEKEVNIGFVLIGAFKINFQTGVVLPSLYFVWNRIYWRNVMCKYLVIRWVQIWITRYLLLNVNNSIKKNKCEFSDYAIFAS